MAPELTKRQKIAHLLRRFGLGATEAELNHLEPMGVDGALDYLLDFEKTDEGFSVDPWQICQEVPGGELYVDGFRFAEWWALRLLMTQRPVEQRLTFFWHNHFVVSGEKVDFGPMLLGYLETLRKNAAGDFPTLLKAASKDPAMLKYLDGDSNVRNHPNENFARELLELFTMGQGAYTEEDIQEAAKAMTGWGNRYLLYEDPNGDIQSKLKNCISHDLPMTTASFSPELFDPGVKKVLGKQGPLDADKLLDMIAGRKETARHITTKIWHSFASDELPEAVSNHLVSVFQKTNGNTKAILMAIAKTDEFWSEACVRRQVKNPIDFVLPILRQLGLNSMLLAARPVGGNHLTPLPQQLRNAGGLVFGTLYRQGMVLLFPPNVGGWPSGKAWISQNNMIARSEFADTIFGTGQPDHPLAAILGNQIADGNPITAYNTVIRLLSIFDAELPPMKQNILVVAFEKAGGVKTLRSPAEAAKSLAAVCRLLFASPEFQLC